MKQCTKCYIERKLDQFYKDKSRTDSLSCWCKVCYRAYAKQYYNDNSEKLIEYNKQWHQDNKQKVLARLRELYHSNKKIN